VLGLCLVAGGALLQVHAAHSVRTELRAALAGGTRTIEDVADELRSEPEPQAGLAKLVAAFDGNRHVRAVLLDPAGRTVAESHLYNGRSGVPRWFVALVGGSPTETRVPLGSALPGWAVALRPDATNEAGETWNQLGDETILAGAFAAISLLMLSLVLARALRPLRVLSAAFARVGSGDFAARVPEGGPRELAGLADGFNRMAARLHAAEARNRRLHEQVQTLQEEERAELARDLHDEVGSLLFAVNVSAAAIGQLAGNGRTAQIGAHVAAIREAVGQMQRDVRAMIGRLRPPVPIDAGLGTAIAALVASWRRRHPEITFTAELPDQEHALDEATSGAIYRIIQESLSNAVRHGRPEHIEVRLGFSEREVRVRVIDDGAAAAAPSTAGLGLVGMRERARALSGTLQAGPKPGSPGWVVEARLPLRQAVDAVA
jgi:two-component system sensor histidine kinase UhpB